MLSSKLELAGGQVVSSRHRARIWDVYTHTQSGERWPERIRARLLRKVAQSLLEE